jgi:hypothetical protein
MSITPNSGDQAPRSTGNPPAEDWGPVTLSEPMPPREPNPTPKRKCMPARATTAPVVVPTAATPRFEVAGGTLLGTPAAGGPDTPAAGDTINAPTLLRHVLRVTPLEVVATLSKAPGAGAVKAQCYNLDGVAKVVGERSGGDMWFGVNPRRPNIPYGLTGDESTITRLSAGHADLDVKPQHCRDLAHAEEIVTAIGEALGTPAAAMTFTGHGIHPLWPIRDGQFTAEFTRDQGAALLRRFGALVVKVAAEHGAAVDTVWDLPRLLRMPGTTNCKDASNPVETYCRYDGDHGMTVAELAAKLDELGIADPDPGHRPAGRLPQSSPGAWEYADDTCSYAQTAMDAWRQDIIKVELDGGERHNWMGGQATRIACMHRYGCLSIQGHNEAERALEEALTSRRELSDPEEVERFLEWGINAAAAKDDDEVARELGGHTHGTGLRGVTPEYLEDLAARLEANAAASITSVARPGPGGAVTAVEVGSDGVLARAAGFRVAAASMRSGAWRKAEGQEQQRADIAGPEASGRGTGSGVGVGVVNPVPFKRAPDPGPFPVDALPPALRAHAEWLMEAANIPASMAGPMYLPVAAAACGRAVILPRPGWVEQGPLWVIIIAPPSTRKSPILAYVTEPLTAAQESLIKRVDLERAAALAEVKIVGDLLSDAEKAYAEARKAELSGEGHVIEVINAAVAGREMPEVGAVGGATRELRDKCNGLQEKLRVAREAVPVRALLSFDDATDAAMQDLMLETGGYALQISPEASDWFIKMVAGDGFFNPGGYLRGYAGEPTVVHRVSRGEVIIENPYLCLLHIIQPEPLGIALKPDANGRSPLFGNGIWARYGAAYVEAVEADVFDRPISGGEDVRAAYAALIEREFLRSYGRVEPLEFVLSDEASALFGSIYNRVERIKESQQQLRDKSMAEEWGKVAGRVLRIARFDTQFGLSDEEVADPGRVHEISVDAIARAWRITEWFVASAAHAMGAAAAITVEELVIEAISWVRKTLRAKGPTPYRTLRGSKRHRDWLDRALDRMGSDGEISMTPGPRSNAIVSPLNLAAAAS